MPILPTSMGFPKGEACSRKRQCMRDAERIAELDAERDRLWRALEDAVLALERHADLKPVDAGAVAAKGRRALEGRDP
jgi:hypothetical protein